MSNEQCTELLLYSVMLSVRDSKWATRKKKDQEPRFKIQDSRFKTQEPHLSHVQLSALPAYLVRLSD